MKIHSYPKIWNLGHPQISELFTSPCNFEEKIDGSQFSVQKEDGIYHFRSKGAEVFSGQAGMFGLGCEELQKINLTDSWIYRGEYLLKPKHNCLTYGRVPKHNFIVFDIETSPNNFLSYQDKLAHCREIGLEVVPTFLIENPTLENFTEALKMESCLGAVTIEGLVCKNYSRFGPDGKVLMGKYVSEAFKEANKVNWKKGNQSHKDILQVLGESYRNENRWQKAVQHLKEVGKLESSPRDIGNLMREVHLDLETEEAEVIKDKLYKWAKNHIFRIATAGLPEWYKDSLLKEQFKDEVKN